MANVFEFKFEFVFSFRRNPLGSAGRRSFLTAHNFVSSARGFRDAFRFLASINARRRRVSILSHFSSFNNVTVV